MAKRPRIRGTYKPNRKRPDWRVTIVGTGQCEEPDCTECHDDDPAEAFAYTSGLLERYGLPELRLEAKADNAASLFRGTELGVVLNVITARYVDREAWPGSTLEETGDNGAAILTFKFGQPQPRDALEAFVAHPEAEVIPVGWTVMMREAGHGSRAIFVGDWSRRIVAVDFHQEGPVDPAESGFTLTAEDVFEGPDALSMDAIRAVCLHCLIEHHSYVGAGLDLARVHGSARWDDDAEQWVPDNEETPAAGEEREP